MAYKKNTVGYWLNQIEDESVKQKALTNAKLHLLGMPCSNVSVALQIAFNWTKVPEDPHFWAKICKDHADNPKYADISKRTINEIELIRSDMFLFRISMVNKNGPSPSDFDVTLLQGARLSVLGYQLASDSGEDIQKYMKDTFLNLDSESQKLIIFALATKIDCPADILYAHYEAMLATEETEKLTAQLIN